MSVAAEQERSRRSVWARPGGSHDKLINVLKAVLPILLGVLAAFLATAPLAKRSEVSFVLDKDKVAVATERMRVTEAVYRGEDNKGQPFSLQAGSAVQRTSRVPIVEMQNLKAQLLMEDGPAVLAARQGRYDIDKEKVMIQGPVEFQSAGGYRLTTRDVDVDLKTRRMVSHGSVDGRLPIGTFSANHLEADLDRRTVALNGRVRLLIVQNRSRGRR